VQVTAPKKKRSRVFFRVRVSILLVILAFVALWAWRDFRSRRERNTWERPLSVAVVLVRLGPIDEVATAAFRARVAALDERLAAERRRYGRDAPRPFMLTFVGPVDDPTPPPQPAGEGVIDAAKQSWALSRWTSRIDRAAGLDASSYDSRVYVAARAPKSEEHAMVEGNSEQGGRVGAVEVELDASMVDFALLVAAHELFHTLGASDEYDAAGRTLIPGGLAEPDKVPLYPQGYTEIMARNRVVSPGVEVPPQSLDELAVGPDTAREIGWLKTPGR
jgi:hypothetical protein